MHKVQLIILREFLTRVKTKQFLIATFIGPILMSVIMFAPILASMYNDTEMKICIHDESGLLDQKLKSTKELAFVYSTNSVESLKDSLNTGTFDGLLIIPKTFTIDKPEGISYYSENALGIATDAELHDKIDAEIEKLKLQRSGLTQGLIDSIKSNVSIQTFKLSDKNVENTSTGAAMAIGYVGAFLMYLFIILYGTQVMRGVVEEKSNRIMEVIISSVKPFQLMLGKIIGVASVGLLQFILWILLTLTVYTVGMSFLDVNPSEMQAMNVAGASNGATKAVEMSEGLNALQAIQTINFPFIIGMFLFYFIVGYLIYASMFAAIGSAVDNDTDSQQLVFPVTVPLLVSFIMAQMIIQNPTGPLAFWFSVIPFTAPVVMMVRLPYDPPMLDIILSMVSMILGFIAIVWVSSRIYRVGVLMYGKKPTLKEIVKWATYRG